MSSSSRILSVVWDSNSNFLKMYDYFVCGYDASAIGKTCFPARSGFAAARSRRALLAHLGRQRRLRAPAGEPDSDVRAADQNGGPERWAPG
jgi:hypothetical protein